jgi:hypothetical protein
VNWIKPSELPEKFHGHCWIVWKGWVSTAVRQPYQSVVQNYYRGTAPDEWIEGSGWSYLSDDNFRVLITEKPIVPDNVFEDLK